MRCGFTNSPGSLAGAGTALTLAAAILAGAANFCLAADVDNADISARRANERTAFTDAEIKDGFFKTAFHGELQFDRRSERIRKFDEPVRVFVANRAAPDRSAQIAAVVADIRAHVAHLDLAMTDSERAANFVVSLVPERELAATIRAHYGAREAGQIQRALDPQCLSGIGKDSTFRIRRAEVLLPADVDDFTFYDCAYEELLQGLGIINDDSSVPWTMFNDDVQMGFFDVYDQYLVNVLYDPRVRPGMGKAAVEKRLPQILPTVRTWVESSIARERAADAAGASGSVGSSAQ
jgi:Protein of unknown function (DUF2927)